MGTHVRSQEQGVSPGAPANPNDSIFSLYIVQLRLMHLTYISHFKAPGYIKDSTLDKFDRIVNPKMVDLTIRESRARETIGTTEEIWLDLFDIFRSGYLSLEQRCYGFDPVTPAYDGPSSNLIVANNLSLLKDLQRLDDTLAMARNVLSAGEKVQNLAAQVGFDREVLTMINLCIKITARGYDGDGTHVEENKWQGVINGFKKLLITCLQFLSNLVTTNERLKLMLWVELFDSTVDPDVNPNEQSRSAIIKKRTELLSGAADEHAIPSSEQSERRESDEVVHDDAAAGNEKEPMQHDVAEGVDGRGSKSQLEPRKGRRSSKSPSSSQTLRKTSSKESKTSSQRPSAQSRDSSRLKEEDDDMSQSMTISKENGEADIFAPPSTEEASYLMNETAEDGIRKLQEGKQQLLKRLENAPANSSIPGKIQHGRVVNDPVNGNYIDLEDESEDYESEEGEEQDDEEKEEDGEQEEPEEEEEDDDDDDEEDEGDEEDDEDDESSEEEYDAMPGDDGRGLLTDVPLILGPNEIEVLPMIIMSGIVTPKETDLSRSRFGPEEQSHIVNMYTIRCHLLLAQENGRNLLRELLIFVAAWDLRDEELYFKFMFKIMEAILLNGLMSFAYGCFKESKDIISPAQAVILKLLTKIFHSRKGFTEPEDQRAASNKPGTTGSLTNQSPRCDIQIVHCLFSEFRQNIIPQICALIFLQGQIRHGYAHLEEFPLNLWDMERMYEGVYQYLEFFAILTDHDFWKNLMGDWEVTSELVTLLRELELAIPKGRIQKPATGQSSSSSNSHHTASNNPQKQPSNTADTHPSTTQPQQSQTQPVAVERPYDLTTTSTASTPTPPSNADPASTSPNDLHDEPADFEWRNLKKLCVLVLSSLVWKNKRLQDQVRRFGGVTAVLSCCTHDEHNPYIREHAIMCLRFLLEGNKENQEVVKKLAEQSGLDAADQARATQEFEPVQGGFQGPLAVPKEVLDQHGYETYVNREGQVGLRRRGETKDVSGATVLMGTAST